MAAAEHLSPLRREKRPPGTHWEYGDAGRCWQHCTSSCPAPPPALPSLHRKEQLCLRLYKWAAVASFRQERVLFLYSCQTKCITQWSLLFSHYPSFALVKKVKFLLPPELATGETFWLQTLRKAQGLLQRSLYTEQLQFQLGQFRED